MPTKLKLTIILIFTFACSVILFNIVQAKTIRLIKTANDAKVFLVDNNRRVHIPNPSVFEAGGYKWGDIKTVSQREISSISDTALIKSPIDAKVYLVQDGKKAWIPDEKTFLDGGLKWSDIIVISQAQVDFYNEIEFNSQSISEIVKPEISTQDESTSGEKTKTSDVVGNKVEPKISENELITNVEIEKTQINNYVKPNKEEIIDVGNFRPESPYTVAINVNDHGDVVGISMANNFDGAHPFLFKDGIIRDIGNGYSGTPYAVNDNGQVVGHLILSYDPGHGGGVDRAFMWEDGKITELSSFSGVASDINNKRQVVGHLYIDETKEFPVHAFLWENGKTIDLGNLGGEGTTKAFAINEAGQVAGCSVAKDGFKHPFLWEKGTMKDLGNTYNLGGCAIDINDSGQVLGYFIKKNEKFNTTDMEPFLWEKEKITLFVDAPVGFFPYRINNNGDILGEIRGAGGIAVLKDGSYYRYKQIDKWRITSSDYGPGFNNNGQIAAGGQIFGESGAYYGIRISLPENLDSQFKIEKDIKNKVETSTQEVNVMPAN